jgi:hypothetical protein
MNKELNIIELSNPFRNEESHCEPRPSTACSSHGATFIYEKFLIEEFPNLLKPTLYKEAKDDIKKYLKKQIELCEQDIAQATRLEKEYNDIIYCRSRHEDFWKAVCKICFLDPLTVEQTKTIKYYNYLLNQIDGIKKTSGGVSEDEIKRAKEYPVTSLITFKRNMTVCPFHREKTPSLYYYAKSNTCRCFGACQKSFDSIEVYRRFNNCSFVEAVRKLQ